jgi:uncharacterized SAM-binding protein YcdF (DUF218 family)
LRLLKLGLGLILIVVCLFAFRAPILAAMGRYLVESEAPRKADVIIVLGGDASGKRARAGCELLSQGYASQVWLSGLPNIYGRSEGQLALELVRSASCPESALRPLLINVDSTRDEAIQISKLLRAAHYSSYLLVTSNYHTRRAARVFREVSPDLTCIPVAANQTEFPVDRWWQFRTTQKIFFNEWVKTVAYWMGK